MHCRRHIALGAADHLPFQHLVAHRDNRLGGLADVLAQRHDQRFAAAAQSRSGAWWIRVCVRAGARHRGMV